MLHYIAPYAPSCVTPRRPWLLSIKACDTQVLHASFQQFLNAFLVWLSHILKTTLVGLVRVISLLNLWYFLRQMVEIPFTSDDLTRLVSLTTLESFLSFILRTLENNSTFLSWTRAWSLATSCLKRLSYELMQPNTQIHFVSYLKHFQLSNALSI